MSYELSITLNAVSIMAQILKSGKLSEKQNGQVNVISQVSALRIRQILINLLLNAIKFTEKGYVRLIVNCLQKNRTKMIASFTIKNIGIVIEKSKLSFIFSRFQ